jgi:hypothetical protein
MTEENTDRFCINCSIAVFVVRVRQVMAAEEAFFRREISGTHYHIDSLEGGELGVHLQLRGVGHFYIPVERVESDMFFRMDDGRQSIVPEWMIA